MREIVYVALGSNLGDRERHLAFARAEIAALPGTRILDATAPEETAPFGPAGQRSYLNQMIALETELTPHALLAALQGIEQRAGRTREVRWGPRTLDLDIVRFGDRAIADERLVVPHPGLPERDFWQRELRALEPRP
jgi:2-amino-4-hydroxy-6-hydroxymethyldihydropteridine diphosphokinase